jgi:hypothetical protein
MEIELGDCSMLSSSPIAFFHCGQVLAMSFEFILRFLRPIEAVFSTEYQTDCDRARAEEGTQTPSLPRTPSRLRRAPSVSPNRNFSPATNTRSG